METPRPHSRKRQAVPDSDSDAEWNSPPPTITPLGRLLRLAASVARVPNGPVASYHGLSLSLKHWEQEFRASTPQRPHLGPAPPALALPDVDPIAVALAAPFAPVPLAPTPLAPASVAPAPVSAGQAIVTLARALPVAADPAPVVFPRLLPARTKLDIQNVCTPVFALPPVPSSLTLGDSLPAATRHRCPQPRQKIKAGPLSDDPFRVPSDDDQGRERTRAHGDQEDDSAGSSTGYSGMGDDGAIASNAGDVGRYFASVSRAKLLQPSPSRS
ncbi:actin organization and endocytosis protein [Lobaria immixta]|nr:actin organization and endocytosis protein [Lobaria immixta]